jgi:hypothetical protein
MTSLLPDARHQKLGHLCEICCNVQRPRETERRSSDSSTTRAKTATFEIPSISVFRIVGANVYRLREVRPPGAWLRQQTGEFPFQAEAIRGLVRRSRGAAKADSRHFAAYGRQPAEA